jgi:hypothetical protein
MSSHAGVFCSERSSHVSEISRFVALISPTEALCSKLRHDEPHRNGRATLKCNFASPHIRSGHKHGTRRYEWRMAEISKTVN